jgi:hypothetical protein
MATTTPSTNLQTGGSSWEPTKKQVEMSTARNPLNFNQQNNMRVPGEKQSFQMSPDQQQQALKNEADKARRQSTPGAPVPGAAPSNVEQMAQQVGQNLGSLGYRLQAKVKQFLSGGPKMFGLQTTGSAEPVYNSATGQWETNGEVTTSLDPTVRQKMAEKQAIAQAAQPYLTDAGTGQQRAKTFSEFMVDQNGQNQSTDYMLGLLDQLHEYEDMGASDSAEARGIWDTLKSLDKDGMVTSLYQAERDYNRYFGIANDPGTEKYSGTDPNEAKSLIDMVNLSESDIRKEVENSVLAASGLFSGDFESNIKDLMDKSAKRVQESRGLSTRARNDFGLALKKYLQSDTEGAGAISKEREEYKEAYSKVSQGIIDELAKTDGGLARAWFEAVGDGDMRETLFAALNDPENGMSTAQRDQIQQLIGDLDQTAGGAKGKLNIWLDDLSTKGYFLTDKGEKVKPTNDQMMKITEVLRDQNLTPEDREVKMKEIVGGIMLDDKTSVSKYLTDAITAVSMGANTEQALAAMQEGMVKSLKDFFKSRTFDLTRKAMMERKATNITDATNALATEHQAYLTNDGIIDEKEWDSLSDAEKMKVTKELLEDNPALYKEAVNDLRIKAQTENTALEGAKAELVTNAAKKLESIKSVIDVDDKGNPTGTGKIYNTLNTLKQKIPAISGTLWNDFITKLKAVPTNKVSQYKNTLAASPYIKEQLAKATSPEQQAQMLNDLAMANAYQDFFRQSGLGAGGSFLVVGSGGTIWDAGTAQSYLKTIIDSLPSIFKPIDITKGIEQGDPTLNDIYNRIAVSMSGQSNETKKAVELYKTNVLNAIKEIEGDPNATEESGKREGILAKALKDLKAYQTANAAIQSIGTVNTSAMFSPDQLFNNVIMPAAKLIESGGYTQVPLDKLDPRLKPFLSHTEGGMAYLDFGDFTGSPEIENLLALTEQAAPKNYVAPVDVEGMDLASAWNDKTFAPSGEPAVPAPILPPVPVPGAPAPAATPTAPAPVGPDKESRDPTPQKGTYQHIELPQEDSEVQARIDAYGQEKFNEAYNNRYSKAYEGAYTDAINEGLPSYLADRKAKEYANGVASEEGSAAANEAVKGVLPFYKAQVDEERRAAAQRAQVAAANAARSAAVEAERVRGEQAMAAAESEKQRAAQARIAEQQKRIAAQQAADAAAAAEKKKQAEIAKLIKLNSGSGDGSSSSDRSSGGGVQQAAPKKKGGIRQEA